MISISRSLAQGALASAAVALTTMAAQAATFTGSFNLSGSAFSDPGLVIQADPMSGSGSFDLDVGESTTFWLFDIWTDETAVNADDRIERGISAAFTLTSPATSGTVTGETDGKSLFGLQWGTLDWDGPIQLAFGDGGILEILLSDAQFNLGLFGLTPGQRHGAKVYATATYVAAPVPLPAAGWALLAGLGALAAARRRKAA